MSIGTQIRDARKDLKWTQKELATRTSLSRSHIAAIERDVYNPSISTLEIIAKVLNTPIEKFLSDKEQNNTIDQDTNELVNDIKENPELRLILNASKKLKPQSLKEVKNFINFKLKNDLDEFA